MGFKAGSRWSCKMEVFEVEVLLLLICSLLIAGHANEVASYDYSATTKCLDEPEKPQYGGGIIVNPEFDDGLKGWSVIGKATIEQRISNRGNRFMVVSNRTRSGDSVTQKLHLEEDKFYAFSAWVQVSEGNQAVSVMFKFKDGRVLHGGADYAHGGAVYAKPGCWIMLKGGITMNFSSPAELYFTYKDAAAEIWVDSVSLQPFSWEQWRSHQDERIEKVRKSKVRFEATDADGTKLAALRLSIKQTKSDFPLGVAITKNILKSTAYQNWFTKRFQVTTFVNEMKWYSTEARRQGLEQYAIPDAMLALVKAHNISVRGHNIFWDKKRHQPWWVKKLSPKKLRRAAERRIDSVASRYSGQLIAWDVVNENIHYNFFEHMLGKNASAVFYSRAHQLDPKTTMFMNEFNTVDESRDKVATPGNYLKKLKKLQDFPGNEKIPFGIGLQAHFPRLPNVAYMRASMDLLATGGFPLWLTELDLHADTPNQGKYLDIILREGYSNPAVEGIVIWVGPEMDYGCNIKMCLVDNNFKNTETGDVVDNLLEEWTKAKVEATTNKDGCFETSLFHGEYELTATHPVTKSSRVLHFKVTKGVPEETIHVKFQKMREES